MMTHAEAVIVRPDMDIEADIRRLIKTYPPLAHDSHYITIGVKEGEVVVTGYVKSAVTARYLLANIPFIDGVKSVVADGLYDDETLRRHVAHVTPVGVLANLEYGSAILIGKLPADVKVDELAQAVESVDGVHRVVTALS